MTDKHVRHKNSRGKSVRPYKSAPLPDSDNFGTSRADDASSDHQLIDLEAIKNSVAFDNVTYKTSNTTAFYPANYGGTVTYSVKPSSSTTSYAPGRLGVGSTLSYENGDPNLLLPITAEFKPVESNGNSDSQSRKPRPLGPRLYNGGFDLSKVSVPQFVPLLKSDDTVYSQPSKNFSIVPPKGIMGFFKFDPSYINLDFCYGLSPTRALDVIARYAGTFPNSPSFESVLQNLLAFVLWHTTGDHVNRELKLSFPSASAEIVVSYRSFYDFVGKQCPGVPIQQFWYCLADNARAFLVTHLDFNTPTYLYALRHSNLLGVGKHQSKVHRDLCFDFSTACTGLSEDQLLFSSRLKELLRNPYPKVLCHHSGSVEGFLPSSV